MAFDKVVDSAELDTGMKVIADAIRAKAGTTGELEWYQPMADAISNIPSGGSNTGGSDLTLVTTSVTSTKGTQEVTPNAGEAFSKVIVNPIPDQYQDVSGVTAQPEQVLDGAYFVDSTGARKEGNIPIRSEADLTATNRAVTVPAGFYETAVTKEVDLNIVEGAGVLFTNEDVKLVRTDSKLLATAVMASEHLLPAGATIEFQMANSRFGNAKKTDVVYGATFTSENGLNIPGTKPVDQGNNTVAEGTAEADSLAQLHYWEKSAVTETITEETVSDYQLWYKSSYGTQSVTYGFSQYAEEIDIIDGALALVDPQSRDGVANSDYDTVLPGKYIQSGTTFYRIPADAVISTYQTTGATRITVDRAFKMTLVSVGGRSIVVSDDSSMFPTNGEQEGYTYVYQGTLNALAKDAVIQALTVTENGTYTPPDGVDGYGPVTVEVPSGGVELPDIAEEERGTAYDLARRKKLIDPDGNVISGKVSVWERDEWYSAGYSSIDDFVDGEQRYISPKAMVGNENGALLREGAVLFIDVPAEDYGHAEPGDVRAGKTFTSKEGFCIPGEAVFPSGTRNIDSNGTFDVTQYASVNVNVATSSGYKSGDIVKAFPASATLASGYNVSSVSASDSVTKNENGVVSLSGVTSTVAIGSIDNVKGRYVKASSGSIYYVPADATITQGGTSYSKTYTADKANLMVVLA